MKTLWILIILIQRAMGLEPTTASLEGWHSAIELRPRRPGIITALVLLVKASGAGTQPVHLTTSGRRVFRPEVAERLPRRIIIYPIRSDRRLSMPTRIHAVLVPLIVQTGSQGCKVFGDIIGVRKVADTRCDQESSYGLPHLPECEQKGACDCHSATARPWNPCPFGAENPGCHCRIPPGLMCPCRGC